MTKPAHISIVMDGNGRWAKARGLSRSKGHEEGARTTKKIVIHAAKAGVKFLTYILFLTKTGTGRKRKLGF